MSDLDKKRDELAGARYSLDNRASFKMGFDAAVSILQPKLDLAVEALEKILDPYFNCECGNYEIGNGIRAWHVCDVHAFTQGALAKIKGGGE